MSETQTVWAEPADDNHLMVLAVQLEIPHGEGGYREGPTRTLLTKLLARINQERQDSADKDARIKALEAERDAAIAQIGQMAAEMAILKVERQNADPFGVLQVADGMQARTDAVTRRLIDTQAELDELERLLRPLATPDEPTLAPAVGRLLAERDGLRRLIRRWLASGTEWGDSDLQIILTLDETRAALVAIGDGAECGTVIQPEQS